MRMRAVGERAAGAKVAPAETDASLLDLKIFIAAFEAFCFTKKLASAGFERVGDVQRYLVATHDLRLKTQRLPRLAGRVWRDAPALVPSPDPFVDHRSTFAAAAAVDAALGAKSVVDAAAKQILDAFLEAHTVPARGAAADELVVRIVDEPAMLSDGAHGFRPGLATVLREWRAARGEPPVDVSTALAPGAVAHAYTVSVVGLRLRNFPGGGRLARLGWDFYLEQVLATVAHVVFLLLPLAFVKSRAMMNSPPRRRRDRTFIATQVMRMPLKMQFRHSKLSAYFRPRG